MITPDELIVDSFAGGGGASLGITLALGRGPDVAINHDAEAVALHRANHPETEHYCASVWQVDPAEVVRRHGGRRVGLLWASPDCKHFSKAKGGKPVKRAIRDLAWVVVLWARRARPRVICLENVEEFRDWGPLVERDGRWFPCPERRGSTFERWVGDLRRLGYRVEWRELRACDYGAPTIRKRLFLVARCDGLPIVWPEPTHVSPDDPEVIAGRKRPWRTAAEILNWSLPCPSIFMDRAEARAYFEATGIRVNRPLAPNTMARIAKGVRRYVLEAAEPFIVPVTHSGDSRVHGTGEPLRTITTARRGELAAVTPFLVPRYGERPGQDPRTRPVTEPAPTVVPTGNGGSLAAVHLAKFRGDSGGVAVDQPAPTVTANSFVTRPGGAPPIGVVAAFLAQHNYLEPGHDAREPLSTIIAKGSTQAVVEVSAGLANLKGRERRMSGPDAPAPTVCAGGWHQAEVRAFLTKYYGADQDPRLGEPLHTVTARARFGLVMVQGQAYEIVDIGMRMLTRRELFRAQGFPEGYAIAEGVGPEGEAVPLTAAASIRLCGNSVCPPLAAAVVRAQFGAEGRARPMRRRAAPEAPLLAGVAAE